MKLAPLMEAEIQAASDVLAKLVERLSAMGLGDSISQWLDGDSSQSFFEFQLLPSKEMTAAFRNIEMLAAKCYTPASVVLVTIYFEGQFYVVLSDATGEQPLLDSRFPDVSNPLSSSRAGAGARHSRTEPCRCSVLHTHRFPRPTRAGLVERTWLPDHRVP